MRHQRIATGAGVLLFSSLLTCQAHHSFAATYVTDKTVRIEGTVIQFVYRNPHSFIQLLSSDKNRKETRWTIEWAATLDLRKTGVSGTSLKPGDHVTAVGYPARNPDDHRLRLKSIQRPSDGWNWASDFR